MSFKACPQLVFCLLILQNGNCKFDSTKTTILKNGVQIGIADDATCTPSNVQIPGIDDIFNFAQFHIHLSSEHTIDGLFYSAELHMVHLNAEMTRAAVVGTMIEPTRVSDNPVFEAYLQSFRAARAEIECSDCLKAEVAGTATPGGDNDIHPYKLVGGNSFFHYDGGLTTPGCDEIVWWNLSDSIMEISVRQFNDLADIILNTHHEVNGVCKKITVANKAGSTSRPIQKLNGRKVERICPTSMFTGEISVADLKEEESSATSAVVGVAGAVTFAAAMASQVL